MSQTATQAEPTTADTPRGFPTLQCPFCGENSCVRVYLDDLKMDCVECEREFTADEVRDIVNRWSAVLRWLDAAPPAE